MDTILAAYNVSKNYTVGHAQVHALKSTTLEIARGEIAVVVGKSGSGKSTFLNVMGGLLVPDTGEVSLEGRSLYRLSERERAQIRNRKCGFVYQNFSLIHELSVLNNIRLPFDIAGKPYDRAREEELLSVLGLEDRTHFYPLQLSGGERQRVAVARALLMRPAIVLADEPTGNLDLESGRRLMAFVQRTNREWGQTFVVVTHDPEWLKIAHTVYRMSDGVLRREAAP